jgi:ribA/ribD-fused uncharacterized protein
MRTPPSNVEELVEQIDAGWQPKFAFFSGHTPSRPDVLGAECLSQWYPAPFTVDDVRYATAEHFMMAAKARLFGDDASARAILGAKTPAEAKKLGRSVAGFDDEAWVAARSDVVFRASMAKFSQDPALRAFLVGTGARVLVEASPTDRIWGIGLAAADERARDPRRWNGLNLLGFALMRARAELVADGP